MLLIQNTKKMASELKLDLSKEQLVKNNPLYSWHAHVFYFSRRKYALIMNNQTRYNFVIGSLRKEEFKRFGSLVKENIAKNLLCDGFDKNTVEKYVQGCDPLTYCPTSERSIVSQINEMIMVTKFKLEEEKNRGEEMNIMALNRFLNRFVMLKLPETYAVEAMREAKRLIN